MILIKLNAIPSTNSFLRALCLEKKVKDFTVVVTSNQTAGRGQRGAVWEGDQGKNLAFSVFKTIDGLSVEQAFNLNMVVSLAVLNALKMFSIPKLTVKWPNDIMSANKKIGGILIENVLKNNSISSSIIGVGLNVNQTQFTNLPQASSLVMQTEIVYDLEKLLNAIVMELKAFMPMLNHQDSSLLLDLYHENLFRKNKPSTFKDDKGVLFTGFILGITSLGRLRVLLEDDIEKTFDLKEISLLY